MKTENFSLASATAVQMFATRVRVIRYDEGAGTGTPLIRVRSMNTGDLDVEMKPGRQIIMPQAVDGIIITNLTANPITGKVTIGAGDVSDNSLVGTVTLDAASLAALESTDLNTATLNTLTRPLPPSAAWADVTAALAANTALTVFTAAANTNGAIIHDLQASDVITGSTGIGGFCARAAAPNSIATFIDDTVVLQIESRLNLGGNSFVTAKLEKETRIPAGKGLFYLQNFTGAGAGSIMRNARYTLL